MAHLPQSCVGYIAMHCQCSILANQQTQRKVIVFKLSTERMRRLQNWTTLPVFISKDRFERFCDDDDDDDIFI